MIGLSLAKQRKNATLPSTNYHLLSTKSGFTIVELLVVIVVIGILAAITIVAYTGISQKAIAATLQSDLDGASKQIKIFQATSSTGDYPTAIVCPTPGATEVCVKASGSNNINPSTGYIVNNSSSPKTFTITETNGALSYNVTNNSAPALTLSLAVSDPTNWLAIGTQVWGKYNLNVGTRINGASAQTNNGGTNVVEKYCFADLESNCTANNNGGLYQWDETMQYVTTQGTQGICPTGSHIPSDNDWKILEMQLGMTQVQADTNSWRGTDQGTQLKPGGTSGLSMPLAGYRSTDGPFVGLSGVAYLWSSSESSTSAWHRALGPADTTVGRDVIGKGYGLSVRCLGN